MQDAMNTICLKRSEPDQTTTRRQGWTMVLIVAVLVLWIAPDRLSWAKTENVGDKPVLTEVRLMPTAVVTGGYVTLGDVAQIEGSSVDAVSDWVILAAPAAGKNRIIKLSDLTDALGTKGINLSNWVFRGASQCRISVPHQAHLSMGNKRDVAALIGAAQSQPSVAPLRSNTLETALIEHITRRLENLPGEPVVKFLPEIQKALSLNSDRYEFRIENYNDKRLGDVALNVTVYEKGKVLQVLNVLADVALRMPIVEAIRPINRGETLSDQNVAVRDMLIEEIDDIGITELASVLGQRARRYIPQGRPVERKAIESVPLVERNDLVTVWVRRGNAVIKATATARSSGTYGEVIELRRGISRETFTGVVIGPKTVEIGGTPHSQPSVQVAQGGAQ